jgi:hypothetical protein
MCQISDRSGLSTLESAGLVKHDGFRIPSGTPTHSVPDFPLVGIGTAPEPAVPTREIRPDVEASNEMAKKEFARERASQAERTWDSELGERPDSELNEAMGESRESEKGKQ